MKMKTRRRKLPVTAPCSSTLSPSNGKTNGRTAAHGSANPKSSARVIRRFHVLLKRKAQLEKGRKKGKERDAKLKRGSRKQERLEEVRGDLGDTDDMRTDEMERELREIEDEMREMGGLEVYQRMSRIGQGKDRGGGSESVFIGWMGELGLRERFEKGKEKMKLLEVGALKPDNYACCSSWIDVLPIDLRASQAGIIEQDFLEMDRETNSGVWDAISLSLVLNFVPEPRDRGRMLQLAYEMLRQGGLLFLTLPLPCVSNSRYLTFEHLTRLMEHIGFSKLRERWKEGGGKMGYWLFRKDLGCRLRRVRSPHGSDSSGIVRDSESGLESESDSGSGVVVHPFNKKVVLREGAKRNNFCILLL